MVVGAWYFIRQTTLDGIVCADGATNGVISYSVHHLGWNHTFMYPLNSFLEINRFWWSYACFSIVIVAVPVTQSLQQTRVGVFIS